MGTLVRVPEFAMNDSRKIPSFEDITPSLGAVLDERSAAGNFFGKTRTEAELMFRTSAIHYGEDMCWMGPNAFRYYFPAYEAYLLSPESAGDWSAVTQLHIMLYVRMTMCREITIWSLVKKSVKYCVYNLNKFQLEEQHDEIKNELLSYITTYDN